MCAPLAKTKRAEAHRPHSSVDEDGKQKRPRLNDGGRQRHTRARNEEAAHAPDEASGRAPFHATMNLIALGLAGLN